MKSLKKAFLWVRTQFKVHTLRSLLVTVSALAFVTAGILWACGVFSAFSYLPDRAYILAETDPREPRTLEELLHSDSPGIDTLLRNPSIAQELMDTQALTDIVDSRMALNNLRSLEEQLTERLAQKLEPATAAAEKDGAEKHSNASAPAESKSSSANLVAVQTGGTLSVSQKLLSEQSAVLSDLKTTVQRLLAPKKYSELVSFPAAVNMKGVWQSPNEVLVHMVPSGDWLPEQGYSLYRVVNGQKKLIAKQLASPTRGLAGTIAVDGAKAVDEDGKEINLIQELYLQAQLTPEKLTMLNMSADEFRAMAYRTDSLSAKARVSGELDFRKMQEALITIPANFEQRIPETDIMLGQTIRILGRQKNDRFTSASVSSFLREKFSVKQAELPAGTDSLGDSEKKRKLAEELLGARQQLATLSFVDDEFAEAAGFLVRDSIEELNLPDGAEIKYIVESSGGRTTTLSVEKGAELPLSKPRGLLGYGIDGKVPLRWQQAESEQERSILGGYHIERKLDGESKFTQITEKPIAVSYMLDETDVYFESPVFFEDTVPNGRTAQYRIYSIDIFGRRSEYSEVCSLRVEKVTPPNAPSATAPELIHASKRGILSAADKTAGSDDSRMSPAAKLVRGLNPNKRGIVLPVFTDSPDTVRFTIYRATAVGAGEFGPPKPIANLKYDNPKPVVKSESRTEALQPTAEIREDLYQVSSKWVGFLKRVKLLRLKAPEPAQPDLIYFDADIQEGCTYKYWISAWDSWNNESAWSQSVSVGVPTDAAPKKPGELSIAMHPRILSDFSMDPPGLIHDGVVTYEDLSGKSDLPQRPAPKGAVTETVKSALARGVTIGKFFPDAGSKLSASTSLHCPSVIDIGYDNLPADKYIHMFVGVRGEDVYPDGTARLKWPAYSGDGLGGYAVYCPLFQTKSIEEMQKLSRDELLRMGRWERLNEKALTQNQLVVGGMNASPGSLSVFLVCLEPESGANSELIDKASKFVVPSGSEKGLEQLTMISKFLDVPEGGYIYVDWPVPKDPQVDYYRVYRSEVSSFKNPIDETKLEWTMVGDRLKQPKYTERVDQSFAHYYYYKVTSVSPWGVESTAGAVQRFRVPATKPPQTPNLLMPLQSKDGVKVQFSAVTHCERYEIYRAEIPRPGQKELSELLTTDKELHAVLFSSPAKEDVYLTNLLGKFSKPSQPVSLNPISRLKTLTGFNAASVVNNLTAIDDAKLRTAYNRILDKYGPLALADYKDLSITMMKLVKWVKIGELPAESNVEEAGPLGLTKPLSFTDSTARYGITYLYTVQAWNDDNLGSSRAEPVEATPRRNRSFDPIDGLEGKIDKNKKPSLTWNPPKMSPLTPEQCLEDTVGYIVYRSDTKDGTYYQASPLLFDNKWTDDNADPYAFNWYKVKVLDTGGYLSEFSKPISVRLTAYTPSLKTVIPGLTTAPKISMKDSSFSITEGEKFTAAYELTGTEPVTVTVKATNSAGSEVSGFSVDAAGRKISAAGLKADTYQITVTAGNDAGKASVDFRLTVHAKSSVPPKLVAREDDYNFKMTTASNYSVQLSATGSAPLAWSLKSSSTRMDTVPPEASIDKNGLLTVNKSIRTGTYNFIVEVSNAAGSDERVVYLTVMSRIGPIQPSISMPPVNPTAAGMIGPKITSLVGAVSRPVTLFSGPPSGQQAVSPLAQLTQVYDYETDQMKCMGFDLTNVKLKKVPYTTVYTGTASLDIGYDTAINVRIDNAVFDDGGGASFNVLRKGTVYLEKSVELKNIGLTLVSLNITPEKSKAQVSGFLKSTAKDRNLAGDLYVFEFENAKLQRGSIEVTAGLPQVRYQQFLIKDLNQITIHLRPTQTGNKLLSMSGSGVYMKFHLETLSNEGLQFDQSTMSFDLQGRMNAIFTVQKEQCLQMLVPGGAALRIKSAVLQYENGKVKPGGRLTGKMVLPFEKATAGGSLVPAVYAGGHPAHNEMDELASGNGELTEGQMVVMGDTLVHYGEAVQQNSLLILPNSFELQDKCAAVPIDLKNWDGGGFLVESSSMDSVRVTNRNVSEGQFIDNNHFQYKQRNQAVIVSPTTVSVDLNRDAFLPQSGSQSQNGAEEILTPKETQMPFWVGIVINGGKLELPSAYLQQKNGKSIEFSLAKGEMIYDLNGFSYQTYLYSSDPKGVPAQFGGSLGGFKDVRIKDCLLDMYANRVNLEVNADVKMNLFHGEWIEAKLFTDEKGEFICSAAPTELKDGLAKGIDVRISGGFFEPEGLKISGQIILPPPGTEGFEIGTDEPLSFTNMLIPSDLKKIRTQDGKNKYACVPLDKPVTVDFEGFPMEVRGFDIKYTAPEPMVLAKNAHKSDWVELTLRGATQLSDSIALSDESTDSLVVKCADKRDTPSVNHKASASVLQNSFEGCVDVVGVLVPKKVQSDDGLVEFDTAQLGLSFLSQLEVLPVKAEARFGYDVQNERSYFAVALAAGPSVQIPFGAGRLKDFAGIVSYNMVAERDEMHKLRIPSYDNIKSFVENMKVERKGGTSFSAGISATLVVLELCEIRNLYFGFESGPIVDAGGELYLPLNIGAIVGEDAFTYVGRTVILYNHPKRYFSFALSIDAKVAVARVGGDLGFEYSPDLFGVYLGYPEMLGGNIGGLRLGLGAAFIVDDNADSLARLRMEFGMDRDVDVHIVYLRGYLYAGADGAYYFGGPDAGRIALELYLKGGINGGIRAAGKRFDIIGFYLDARGSLTATAPYTSWDLACSCKVSYSLDLWLVSVEGSVNARFDTTIG